MNKYSAKLAEVTNKKNVNENNLKYFQEDEVGLYHWDNNSVVAIRDNGCIDAFVESTVGIRLDSKAQSINMFAPKINMYGTRTHIRTEPYSLVWNKWRFNPELYGWCSSAPLNVATSPRNFKLVCDYEVLTPDGWEHVQALVPPYLKDNYQETYSTEVRAIINELGIKI
jgi:hypothetical protein